jgi:phosphoribosylamine--glycine ligase
MRFLGVGDAADLAALYLRLAEDGHDVKICIGDSLCRDTLSGMVERVADWRCELDWVRAAGDDGCILFENNGDGRGRTQDELRRDGYNVIGSSGFGERLEHDRAYAQRTLRDLGFATAPVFEFSDPGEACRFVHERPARYVLKPNGAPYASTYVGLHRQGHDIHALLEAGATAGAASFILMEHLEGVEMGVGAYFNGAEFLSPACLDWEHKRFFEGDLGELTGEMGTVVTYTGTRRFFGRTLAKLAPLLKENGYCGYINLNTIVNRDGIWPLEFTCRFGYPGYAILDPLQRTSWAELFRAMIRRSSLSFEVEPGFAVGVVVTTPPFPYSRLHLAEPVGLPVLIEGERTLEERRHLHYGEVGMKDGILVTTGASGYTLVVTGTGDTVEEARRGANARAERVMVINARYRRDIGQKLIDGELERIQALDLFGD